MLNGVTVRLFTPASDRRSRYQSCFKDCKAFGYAVYLLTIINRNETTPASLRIPHSLFSFLLVGCQPFNPLPPGCAVVINPGLFQCVSMGLAVRQAVKDRGFLHRDIQQTHQLARLNSYPTSRQEGFNIHFSGADRHGAPAFQLPVATFFSALQLPGTVEQSVSGRGNIFGTTALPHLIKR